MTDTPHCLVIDESLMVRRVAARIIRDFGYEVLDTKTGQEAIDMARIRLPDVILLDWHVGDMSATEVIDDIRSLPKGEKTCIIFCTAQRSLEQIRAALYAGADEYIMKPFDSDIIESKFRLAGLPVGRAVQTDAA
ncbi:MAG: response regulator [Pseudomonadota bacterium]